MLNRHRGFLAYVKDHDIDCEVYDCTMQPNDFLYNIQLFDRFFRENPHISHIITLNSRAYMIAEWMEIRGVKDKVLLGFEMPEEESWRGCGRDMSRRLSPKKPLCRCTRLWVRLWIT